MDVPLTTRTPVPRSAPITVRTHPAGPLYREGGVLVTYELFQVRNRRYRVADLTMLRTVRGGRTFPAGLVVAVAALVAALAVGLVLGLQPGVPGVTVYVLVLLVATVPTVVVLAGGRSGPQLELWGEYRGTTQRLFVTTDARRFGQVTRALLRAYEANRR